MKSAVYFFLGLVLGAAGGAYVAKSIAERKAEDRIEKATIEARDYYKEKYDKKADEITKENVDKVVKEVTRIYGKAYDIHADEPVVYPNVQEVDEDIFEEADGYFQCFLNYYSDKVLTDEEGNPVDNPEDMVGEYVKELDPVNDKIYVRNDATNTKYEITYIDSPFDEFSEDE